MDVRVKRVGCLSVVIPVDSFSNCVLRPRRRSLRHDGQCADDGIALIFKYWHQFVLGTSQMIADQGTYCNSTKFLAYAAA